MFILRTWSVTSCSVITISGHFARWERIKIWKTLSFRVEIEVKSLFKALTLSLGLVIILLWVLIELDAVFLFVQLTHRWPTVLYSTSIDFNKFLVDYVDDEGQNGINTQNLDFVSKTDFLFKFLMKFPAPILPLYVFKTVRAMKHMLAY